LEKGKYTQTPVQTQFGWHVILREDSRPQVPPPFEAIKDQLRPSIQQQKVQAMLEGLRKQAKVEILMPVEKPNPVVPPMDASATPAADKPVEPAKAEPEATTDKTAATPTAEAKPEAEPAKAAAAAEPAKK
jgi:peptidyl-prolyl cis-trans isomerase C